MFCASHRVVVGDLAIRPHALQIVSRIRAIERFVAEWKISDDVALDSGLKERPLKPGWIAKVTTRDASMVELH
jgi:hypothetical protein